jgi:hypothetical protein
MFTPSSRLTAIICVGFLVLLGCSKTQDTAPETRVFGDPPVIVNPTATTDMNAIASCDFSDYFLAFRGMCDDSAILLGSIIVESRYTEVTLEATVTDPDDPPPPSIETDVLLVAASFVTDDGSGTAQEDTIVLFDDGAQILFPFGQKDARGNQDCFFDTVNKVCTCNQAFYDVTSNDLTANDKLFTRKFAFAPTANLPDGMEGLYLDCIAKGRGQAASAAADIAGQMRDFRFEAVDNNGNLTEASNRPSAMIGSSSLTCSGDPCACCLLLNSVNPGDDQVDGGCRDLDGLMFDPNAMVCHGGDDANGIPRYGPLIGTPCTDDDDCDGPPLSGAGEGLCELGGFNRECSDGFCKSTRCLRP